MLKEHESRILSLGLDALAKDFEPLEAVPSMYAKQIFGEHEVDIINTLPQRKSRVVEFVRQYRRAANNLQALIDFFIENRQNHLANVLTIQYIPEERPLLSTRQIELRLMRNSNVPGRLFNYVDRPKYREELESTLISVASQEHFWVVIHGCAGCGKSCLVAETLRSCPALLSRYFDTVFWIRDGRTVFKDLLSLFSDFMVMVSVSWDLNGRETPHQILPLIRASLVDKPNSLIVLDDVFLKQSVRFFDELGCRILATSRDVEIFQVCRTQPTVVELGTCRFTANAIAKLMPVDLRNGRAVDTIVQKVKLSTAGLPALVSLLINLSRNNIEILDHLCNLILCKYSLEKFDCTSSYWYSNMHSSIMDSFKLMRESEKFFLYDMIIFEPDSWIPLELLASYAPVDVGGVEDPYYPTLEMLQQLAMKSFVEECCEHQGRTHLYSFRFPLIINLFLYSFPEVVERIPERRSILRDRINGKLLLEKFSTSIHTMRIRNYVSKHPELLEEQSQNGAFMDWKGAVGRLIKVQSKSSNVTQRTNSSSVSATSTCMCMSLILL